MPKQFKERPGTSSAKLKAASLIPNASLVTLDAGHFIPLDQPNDVADCLRAFFRVNHSSMDFPTSARKRTQQGDAPQALVPATVRNSASVYSSAQYLLSVIP
jgi:hypothetical protein